MSGNEPSDIRSDVVFLEEFEQARYADLTSEEARGEIRHIVRWGSAGAEKARDGVEVDAEEDFDVAFFGDEWC